MTAPRTIVALAAAALLVASCGPDDEPETPDPTEEPAGPYTGPPGEPEDAEEPDEPEEPDGGADEGVEPLTDQRSLDDSTDEGGGGALTVTDVRIGAHDGFDRVVFEIAGEGPAGWLVHYVDEPRTQGRGDLVDIEGEAFLEVIIRGVALPPDAEHEPWGGEQLTPPAGATVLELVEDTIFEGQQVFHIGLPERLPFGVVRLDDPQRIVVEIDHP